MLCIKQGTIVTCFILQGESNGYKDNKKIYISGIVLFHGNFCIYSANFKAGGDEF